MIRPHYYNEYKSRQCREIFRSIGSKAGFEMKRRLFESLSVTPNLFEAFQLRQVRKILLHAVRTTDYWRSVFSNIAVNGFSDIPDFEAFETLPVLTRAFMKKWGTSMFLSGTVPDTRRVFAYTSGSTGEPYGFYQDKREFPIRRWDVLYGLRLNGIRVHGPAIILGLRTHLYLEPLGVMVENLGDEKTLRDVLYPAIEKLKPKVIFCTPSALRMLKAHLEQDGRKIFFETIDCAGEKLDEDEREVFSRFFCSRISTWYGTREIGPIAVECLLGSYHLLPWSNYIEIVNSEARPLRFGQEGCVVATSFSNFAMPFIRYNAGDRGMLVQDVCKCGSRIPVLVLKGRLPEVITTPSGKSFSVAGFGTEIAKRFAVTILQFQLVEEKPGFYTFRFVPGRKYEPGLDTPLLDMLRNIIGQKSIIALEKVSGISPNASGKTPTFLRETNLNGKHE